MRLRTGLGSLSLALVVSAHVAAQQLAEPAGWKWVPDAPARHSTALDPKPGEWLFGQMPPGWHITTGPGVVLFEPGTTARGRFVLEAETFLFPGDSAEGYGLLLGGRDLESAGARYLAFLVRRDGSAAVERMAGAEPGRTALVAWTRHGAILPQAGKDTAKNVLRVEVEADAATFLVNGAVVAELPRGADDFDGLVGFRIGAAINVHITNLDVTARRAPPRRPRS